MAVSGSSTNKNDVIVGTSTTEDSIDAGNGNDIIDGGYGDDTIYGGNGKDLLFGGVGSDWLYGGNGIDIVYGGSGDDYINSRTDGTGTNDNGTDTIYGDGFDGVKRNADGTVFLAAGGSYVLGSYDDQGTFVESARTYNVGSDLIYGGNGSEIIYGDNGLVDSAGNSIPSAPGGNDTIYGGNGNDRIYGEGGDDILVGEFGADTLTGGSGSDSFVYYVASESSSSSGIDRVTDFSTGDAIVVNDANFTTQPSDGNGASAGANHIQVASSGGVTTLYIGTDATLGADLVIQLDGTFVASQFLASGNQITLRSGNGAPVLSGIGVADQSVDENSAFSLTVPANLFTDPDGDTLTYSATLADGSALPSWLTFNAATRTFSGTPHQGDEGAIEVKVMATDPHGLSASDNFALTVANTNDAPVLTAAGLLDPTFGGDGTVTTAIGTSREDANAVALQADGKIVVAGFTYNSDGTGRDYGVVRYNPDGSLDTSFGSDGTVVTSVDGPYESPWSIAIQADGKIIVAGNNYGIFALVRYNADGSRDAGFGVDGIVKTHVGPHQSSIAGIALQDDGKIVAAGWSANGTDHDFALARYNTDGGLDTTFSGDGKLTLAIGTGEDEATGVVLQPDGKIVVGGWSFNGTDNDFTLARFNADGSLDTSFGSAGIRTTAFSTGNDEAYGVALQADGKIVLAGWTWTGAANQYDLALARYNADGSLDTSFGNGGKVVTAMAENWAVYDIAYSVVVQADGKIVLAGETASAVSMARFNADGSLDTSFADDGKLMFSMSDTGGSGARGMVLQADGNIVVAGTDFHSNGDFGVARITGGGLPDQSVDENSAFSLTVPANLFTDPDGDTLTYSATLADGSALPSWLTFNATTRSFSGTPHQGDEGAIEVKVTGTDPYGLSAFDTFALTVANTNDAPVLTAAGLLDPTFGGDGTITTAIGTSREDANAVALQADSKIVVAGFTYNSDGTGRDYGIVRYNPDGSLDTSFGSGGKVVTSVDGPYESPWSIAIQADGKIIVAGDNYGIFALVRYNADGSRDAGFGVDGIVKTQIGPHQSSIAGIALQDDGKIVAAGWSANGTDHDFALVRYNTDGSLDTTFSGDGKLTLAIGSGNEEATGVVVQPDGKIVVGGWSFNGTDNDFMLARFNADGSLDASFGSGGIRTTAFGTGNDQAFSIALQPDGKVVVGGWTWTGETNREDYALARYNADGSLDTSFGTGGKVITAMAENWAVYDVAFSVAVQADGKIVLAGETASHVSMARYNADGSLDTSFAEDGLLMFSMSTGGSGARGMVLQADGNIVVAGTDFHSEGDFGVARITGGGLPDQSVDENSAFSLTVPANLFSDPDGDTLTYSATLADDSPLPSWLTFNETTRTFSGTPPQGDEGAIEVMVTGIDPYGLSAIDLWALSF